MNMPHAASIEIRSIKNPKRPNHAGDRQHKLFMRGVLLLAFLLLVGFSGRSIYHRLCQCDFFQITSVRIEGNRMTSKEQIATLSRVDIHSNLLALDVMQVETLLESHPWIARAEVIRDWPNQLLINLQEKIPAALINREAGLFYLDSGGRIIAAASPLQELDFPVITGLEGFPFDTAQPGAAPAPLQQAFELLRVANRNNPVLPQQSISEIHIAANGELILFLLDRPFPIYFGSDGTISTRYYRLVKVLKDLYKTREFSEVSYIRLDYQKDTILVGKLAAGRTDQG